MTVMHNYQLLDPQETLKLWKSPIRANYLYEGNYLGCLQQHQWVKCVQLKYNTLLYC